MRNIFIVLLALLSFNSYGQKQIQTYPVYTGVLSDSDNILGSHLNANGTYTTYNYNLTSSITDTIISYLTGVTYSALDSGLATRMNALTAVNIVHGNSTGSPLASNVYARLWDSSDNPAVVYLPNNPLDGTINVLKLTGRANSGWNAVLKCQGGQRFNVVSIGSQTDTIKLVGQSVWCQYRRADSTWSILATDLPLSQTDKRYSLPGVVNYATAVALAPTATYSNGDNGVGATLTGSGNASSFVDGTGQSVGDLILVKNQSSSFQNGIYIVTQVGVSSVSPYILTRVINYNSAYTINNTSLVGALSGATNAGSTWGLSAPITTIGTDAITYTKFSPRDYPGIDTVLGVDSITNHNMIFINRKTRTWNLNNGTQLILGFDADGSGRIAIKDTAGICAIGFHVGGSTYGVRPGLAEVFIGSNGSQVDIQVDSSGPSSIKVKGRNANYMWTDSATIQKFDAVTGFNTKLRIRKMAGNIDDTIALYGNVPTTTHTTFVPVTTGTVTLVNSITNVINPAGTIAALTINPPASANNNDAIVIKFEQTVTAITSGILGMPSTAVKGTTVIIVYDSGAGGWY